MRRTAAARQRDNEIGLSFDQHLLIADRSGGAAELLPIGREPHMLDAPQVGPLASNAIGASRIAFDQHLELMLFMKPIERCVREGDVFEVSPAADQYPHPHLARLQGYCGTIDDRLLESFRVNDCNRGATKLEHSSLADSWWPDRPAPVSGTPGNGAGARRLCWRRNTGHSRPENG